MANDSLCPGLTIRTAQINNRRYLFIDVDVFFGNIQRDKPNRTNKTHYVQLKTKGKFLSSKVQNEWSIKLPVALTIAYFVQCEQKSSSPQTHT